MWKESRFSLNLGKAKLNSPRTEERLKNCRNEEHLLSAKPIWEHSRDDSACRDAKEETHFADNFQIFLIAYEIPLAIPSVAETIRHVELPSFALHHSRRIRNWIICLEWGEKSRECLDFTMSRASPATFISLATRHAAREREAIWIH